MFTPPAIDTRMAAAQLRATLERYEQQLALLVAKGYEAHLYSRMSRRFDEMRGSAAALPQLSVPWVTLLISRVELTHALYLAHNGNASAVERQFTVHTAAVSALKQACAEVLRD
jgi:hypothetical protein